MIAKKAGFSFEEMKEMTFITLANMLHTLGEKDVVNAGQTDINNFLG